MSAPLMWWWSKVMESYDSAIVIAGEVWPPHHPLSLGCCFVSAVIGLGLLS